MEREEVGGGPQDRQGRSYRRCWTCRHDRGRGGPANIHSVSRRQRHTNLYLVQYEINLYPFRPRPRPRPKPNYRPTPPPLSLALKSAMDSLLANYASSDDDEDQQEGKDPKPSSSIDLPSPKSKPSLFSTLPPPKTLAPSSSSSPSTSTTSSSLFSSLPPPKSQLPNPQIDPNPSIEPKESRQKKKPIFASLPPPKSQQPPNPNSKRVVQFTLPLNPSLLKPDEDDEEEEQQRKPSKDSSSSATSKGLCSMLPAPKNSLCLAPTATSRRSAFDSSVSSSSNNEERNDFGSKAESSEQERGKIEEFGVTYPAEQGGASGYENYGSYDGSGDANGAGYVSGYENYGCYDDSWASNGSVDSSSGTGYVSGGGGDYGSYAGNWSDVNAAVMVVAPVAAPEMERIVGKRGRNEIPAEIVEVNQAELIKNRPREDQVKVTGIAFGPAYQVWF